MESYSRKAKYYKNLFVTAGTWNIGAALLCWLGGIFIPSFTFGLFGMPIPESLFQFHAIFWFIITFGIGYIIVSLDITKNQGIVIVGVLGKIIFFIDCIIALLLKEANFWLVLTGSVDLIFALLFIDFLYKNRKVAV